LIREGKKEESRFARLSTSSIILKYGSTIAAGGEGGGEKRR